MRAAEGLEGTFLKFERKSPKVVVAFIDCVRTDIRGKEFKTLEAVRAIKENGGWRIDQTSAVAGAWMPWEPVDRKTYRRLGDAKRALRAYAQSCKRKRS